MRSFAAIKKGHIVRCIRRAIIFALVVAIVGFGDLSPVIMRMFHPGADRTGRIMDTARAATGGQMKLYFHKEPSDANATYNSLSLTPPEPGADTASAVTSVVNANATPPTAMCESSNNTGETFNRVNAAATLGNRCLATFISGAMGTTVAISTADAGAIAANLWIVDSNNASIAGTNIYLYKWDGTTLTLFKTLTNTTDPGTTITQVTWAATAPDANVTLNPTDRIVAIVTRNVTKAGSGVGILFDSTARTAAAITLAYTTLTPNKPTLTGSKDDDFELDTATTNCTTGGIAYNTKWTCLTGSATNSAGSINSEDLNNASVAGDSSSWLWLQNRFTAVGTPSNFGATPSNTFLYQVLPLGYGDGAVQSVVNSTMAYTIGASNPASPYSHSGVVLWASNTDYLEVQVYASGAKSAPNTVNVALNNSGTLSGITSLNPTVTSGLYDAVWIGFQKTGNNYQAQYSTDGATWTNIGSPVAHATAFTRVGLNAYTGVGAAANTYTGAFEWFEYAFSGNYPTSGDLTSAVFDTAVSAGAAFNSIMWKGTLGGSLQDKGKVQFQFATANDPAGPWNFVGGSTCSVGDWYDPGAASVPIELSCAPQYHTNQRYFRYKIRICSLDCSATGGYTPIVDDVVVSWAP